MIWPLHASQISGFRAVRKGLLMLSDTLACLFIPQKQISWTVCHCIACLVGYCYALRSEASASFYFNIWVLSFCMGFYSLLFIGPWIVKHLPGMNGPQRVNTLQHFGFSLITFTKLMFYTERVFWWRGIVIMLSHGSLWAPSPHRLLYIKCIRLTRMENPESLWWPLSR